MIKILESFKAKGAKRSCIFEVRKDEFGNYFKFEKGIDYNSLLKSYGSRSNENGLYQIQLVKLDKKGLLYVNFDGYHVYCMEETSIKEGDEVFVDTEFYWYGYGIFGVSLDKKVFETWRIRITKREFAKI